MDFTREPIIETVVTPKEGSKLVVRSSKAGGQEEYFVDSVEVITFGNSVFYRSQERPKAFMVPATDYEILEVREARMVLKNVGLDRSIKIGGGREQNVKQIKEPAPEKVVQQPIVVEKPAQEAVEAVAEVKPDNRKKDKRRQYRRRRGRQDESLVEGEANGEEGESSETSGTGNGSGNGSGEATPKPTPSPSVILAPPPMLISETIARYKDNALFKGAFYTKEEVALREQSGENQEKVVVEALVEAPLEPTPTIPLVQPEYGSFESTEAEEEEIYKQRTERPFLKENDDMPSTAHFGEEKFPDTDYSTPKREEH